MESKRSSSYLWKIGAPAGFGVMVTGLSMSKLVARHGLELYDYTEYPSLIQGGHNTYEVHFANQPVLASKHDIDLLICLNAETYTLHQHRLTPQSLVLFDKAVFEQAGVQLDTLTGQLIDVPLQDILDELKAPKISLNMAALAASLSLMGGKLEVMLQMIEEQFGRKSPEVVEQNQAVAQAAYDYVTKHHQESIQTVLPYQPPKEPTVVLTGNDAFSLGAVAADIKLYVAYPMSPSSSVLATLASWSEKHGFVTRHAEDEIGVINEALGASFAGARAAVGTSGGGFALMTESVSYAGVAEIPIVIFIAQRPGPATGMPTWTEQGDLLFAVHGGHGEFPKIVLAPGDATEMLELTTKAFNLADIYQAPVIVLSDKMLSESHWSLSESTVETAISKHPVDRGSVLDSLGEDTSYERYALTDSGISPRLLPGTTGGYYQANSYEHLPDSHTSEDAEVRVQQVEKRQRKVETYLREHFEPPQVIGDLEAAKLILVSWGSNKGAILEAMKITDPDSDQLAFIHYTHVFPLDREAIAPLHEHSAHYLLIENNSTAQFGQILSTQANIQIPDTLLKYNGRPFYTEEIVTAIHERLSEKQSST